MRNITPRPASVPRRAVRVLFLLLGLVFTAWETRIVWQQLGIAIRKFISRA